MTTWTEIIAKAKVKLAEMPKKKRCDLFHKLAAKWHPSKNPKHAYVRVTDVFMYGVQPRRLDIFEDVKKFAK